MAVDVASLLELAKKVVGPRQSDVAMNDMLGQIQQTQDSNQRHNMAVQIGSGLGERVAFAEGGVEAVPNAVSTIINKYVQPVDRMYANKLKNGSIYPGQFRDPALLQNMNRLNEPGGEFILAIERALNAGDKSAVQQIGNHVLRNIGTFPKEIVQQVVNTLRLPSLAQ